MAIHVYPVNDWIDHHVDDDAADCNCPCEPEIRWVDKDTGVIYSEAMIIHNALDGRDSEERSWRNDRNSSDPTR